MVEIVCLGVAHVLVYTKDHELYGWGDNKAGQILIDGPECIQVPMLLNSTIIGDKLDLKNVTVTGMACGSKQSFIWTENRQQSIPTRLPFVIDLTENTFRLLEQILSFINSSNNPSPPTQDKECICVASLKLLRLQVLNIFCYLIQILNKNTFPDSATFYFG